MLSIRRKNVVIPKYILNYSDTINPSLSQLFGQVMMRKQCRPKSYWVLIKVCNTVNSRYFDLSRITAYLEVKIWSLFKHENLTTCNKILLILRSNFSLFHNIFESNYIFICEMWLFDLFFSSILQIQNVKVRISQSISESPLDFEITRVDCVYHSASYSSRKHTYIILTPLKPHFYTVKLGFTGVYIIFLSFAQKHRLWVLFRTTSLRHF